jgi:hypothetical protein
MMRAHRRVHRGVWIVLALLLPVLFIAGLLSRRSETPRNPAFHWEKDK